MSAEEREFTKRVVTYYAVHDKHVSTRAARKLAHYYYKNNKIDRLNAKLKNKYGVDGVMIGRAAIGAPWFFRQVKQYLATGDSGPAPYMAERIKAVRTHLKHSLEWKGERLGIVEMRRHYANYFRGLPHFKEHRLALVTLDKPDQIFEKLDHIAEAFGDHVFA